MCVSSYDRVVLKYVSVTYNITRFYDEKIIIIIIIISSSSSSSSSSSISANRKFFPLVIILPDWLSTPQLRLQISDCITFRVMFVVSRHYCYYYYY